MVFMLNQNDGVGRGKIEVIIVVKYGIITRGHDGNGGSLLHSDMSPYLPVTLLTGLEYSTIQWGYLCVHKGDIIIHLELTY